MPAGASLSESGVALAVAHSRCRVQSLSSEAPSEALAVIRVALDRTVSDGSVHACVRALRDWTRRQALFKEVLTRMHQRQSVASESSAGGSAGAPGARHSFSNAAVAKAM
jgi:hypothetical protein